jgi:hypothetical protein
MLILEVADAAEPASPWASIFFGVAIAVAVVYFGWQLFQGGKAARARALEEADDSGEPGAGDAPSRD